MAGPGRSFSTNAQAEFLPGGGGERLFSTNVQAEYLDGGAERCYAINLQIEYLPVEGTFRPQPQGIALHAGLGIQGQMLSHRYGKT